MPIYGLVSIGCDTECFMLQVVAIRTTYGQLREGKWEPVSRKRRQIKRLWDLRTWFGTRRSKVQIHSRGTNYVIDFCLGM